MVPMASTARALRYNINMNINPGDLVLCKEADRDKLGETRNRIGIVGEQKILPLNGMVMWYVHWDDGKVKMHQEAVIKHFKHLAETLEKK